MSQLSIGRTKESKYIDGVNGKCQQWMSRLNNFDYRDYGACNVYHLSHISVCRIDRLWIYFALSVWVMPFMVLNMNILCICLQTNKSTIDKNKIVRITKARISSRKPHLTSTFFEDKVKVFLGFSYFVCLNFDFVSFIYTQNLILHTSPKSMTLSLIQLYFNDHK